MTEAERYQARKEYHRAYRAANRDYYREYRQLNQRKVVDARKVKVRFAILSAKERAKKKGLPFDLDQYTLELQDRLDKGCCEMTGIPFDPDRKGRQWNSHSIDRIDPEKGYVYDNIRIICWAMNSALGTWGEATLRVVMKAWLEKQA